MVWGRGRAWRQTINRGNVVRDAVTAVGRQAFDMAQQLRSGSVALDREVQALFDTWKGSAADAYREGWDDRTAR
ncbi:WXG100 family type VII secretion target [Nocardia sp. NPDC047038]|uniref:WXG100 family type VII secretion target n=1 Tax=Nocardia sp. NPDC047038 TaxID=3154338 RepID=UPI0033F07371